MIWNLKSSSKLLVIEYIWIIDLGKSNRKYTVDGREISFQDNQTTKKESNGMKNEVDRNSQDEIPQNKRPTLVYNSEASRFEESTLNFHG